MVCAMSDAKYALVTGGNRGIGLEVCRQLVSEGKPLLFTARNAEQGETEVPLDCSGHVETLYQTVDQHFYQ